MQALSEIRCVQSGKKIGEKCFNDRLRQTIYEQLSVGLRDRHNNAALAYFRVYWLLNDVFGCPFVTLGPMFQRRCVFVTFCCCPFCFSCMYSSKVCCRFFLLSTHFDWLFMRNGILAFSSLSSLALFNVCLSFHIQKCEFLKYIQRQFVIWCDAFIIIMKKQQLHKNICVHIFMNELTFAYELQHLFFPFFFVVFLLPKHFEIFLLLLWLFVIFALQIFKYVSRTSWIHRITGSITHQCTRLERSGHSWHGLLSTL